MQTTNMSHVLARVVDVMIVFTVNTNLPFRTATSFLEIWTNPTIHEATFAVWGNNAGLLPSINAIRSRQFDCLKPQDHMSESSVLYSLHILHSKQQTHHDSRHWSRLSTGSATSMGITLTVCTLLPECMLEELQEYPTGKMWMYWECTTSWCQSSRWKCNHKKKPNWKR